MSDAILLHDDADVEAEMQAIQCQITWLEEKERELATQYGMVGDVDSVEVFDKTKSWAFTQDGPQIEDDLRMLDKLNNLRITLVYMQFLLLQIDAEKSH
ncbi:hypothetical protein IW262DRAFT_1469292 [Armillaria fumosa]|nr:hypothetical protein IW262DRAFT_1469292 [Armillaria fumosa]